MGDVDARTLEDPLVSIFYAAEGRRISKAVSDMEKYFSPDEMVSFGRALRASDHPARETVLKSASFTDLLGARHVQPFRRTSISRDVGFYSDGGLPGNKTLIIGFGGMGGRLGAPIANILQKIDATCSDVVVMRDPLQKIFVFGAGDFAPDFTSLIAAIRNQFQPDKYRRLVTIGNSMGATPALRAGFLLNAERAIGVGTRLSNDDLKLMLRREVGPAFDPFCDCLRHHPHRGLLVHGDACAPDVADAKHMAALGAGRRVIFTNMSEHNLIGRFWAMGELGAFLGLLLNGQLPTDRHSLALPFVVRRTWLPRLRASLKRRLALHF
jgi:hypothetical protein